MRKLAYQLFSFLLFITMVAVDPVKAGDHIDVDRTDVVAVNGYDPVAYFTMQRPVQGLDRYVTSWNGATWKFSSVENRKRFQDNPRKYSPQYGGYCAFAVAHGSKAPGDPHQWHVHEGKLYLNLNADVRRRWLVDKERLISQADQHWSRLKK